MRDISLVTKSVDVVPLVKYYLEEIHMKSIFDKYISTAKQAKIDASEALCLLIVNILAEKKPLYKVDEWLKNYSDGLSENLDNAKQFNDDRLGWALDKLFDADRHSLRSDITIKVIKTHELKMDVCHNDTTTVTFQGNYEHSETSRGVKLRHGHNKDFRPDLKQIVLGVSTTSDGHVPIDHCIFDGNSSDDKTHISSWNRFKKLAGNDFIYVADSKLCNHENMGYIAKYGGKFITIMPKNRKEVKAFYEKMRSEAIPWEFAYEKPNSRNKKQIDKYQVYDKEISSNGYRVVWVHSSSKQKMDKSKRDTAIKKSIALLKEIERKLNKWNLKNETSIVQAINNAIQNGAKRFVDFKITENRVIENQKKGAGRPTKNSKYLEIEHVEYSLEWSINHEKVDDAEKIDGIFPLVTNTDLLAKDVLLTYKDQPYLEKRHSNLKSVLEVAPMFLKKSERIEALVFLYSIAMMVMALIERRINLSMAENDIKELPILPSRMKTKKVTWNNLRYFLRTITLATAIRKNEIVHQATNGISELHQQVLNLLRVPIKVYENFDEDWWRFKSR